MRRKTRLYLVGILSVGYMYVAALDAALSPTRLVANSTPFHHSSAVISIVKVFYQYNFPDQKDTTFGLSVPFWGFVHFNISIAAACAPMLKPIVGKFLGLEDGLTYGSDAQVTPLGNLPRRQHKGLETQFSELDWDDDRNSYLPHIDTGRERTTKFYKQHTPEEQSGSEELIIQGARSEPRGIMKTTEFVFKS